MDVTDLTPTQKLSTQPVTLEDDESETNTQTNQNNLSNIELDDIDDNILINIDPNETINISKNDNNDNNDTNIKTDENDNEIDNFNEEYEEDYEGDEIDGKVRLSVHEISSIVQIIKQIQNKKYQIFYKFLVGTFLFLRTSEI